MSEPDSHDIEVEAGGTRPRIAVRRRAGQSPEIVWLGGFRSDMEGTKAAALDAWGARDGRGVVRFDYSGHGRSGGDFLDGTIGGWRDEAAAVVGRFCEAPPVLVGSSMGGWIAVLLALEMERARAPAAGVVLIAPAIDMTERLMWSGFTDDIRAELMAQGVWSRPSEYDPAGYPITRRLIEEGRSHLLFDSPTLKLGCPVHILHGRDDPDVPLDVSLDLVAMLADDDVTLTVVHDGDHRLSRPDDIALLVRIVGAMARRAHAPSSAS